MHARGAIDVAKRRPNNLHGQRASPRDHRALFDVPCCPVVDPFRDTWREAGAVLLGRLGGIRMLGP